jgi:hypothetical protein
MQTQGYMIVLEPETLIKMDDKLLVSACDIDYIPTIREPLYPLVHELHNAFAAFDPKRCLGIQREFLFPYPSVGIRIAIFSLKKKTDAEISSSFKEGETK